MNNEPVGWMVDGVLFTTLGAALNISFDIEQPCIPLYTHPANPKYDPETGEPLIDGYPLFSGLPPPAKTLTDEEIDEIASMCSVNEKDQINDREFARAILKKASEK
jgi:hypothetical protein